jgi:hypothetical protein
LPKLIGKGGDLLFVYRPVRLPIEVVFGEVCEFYRPSAMAGNVFNFDQTARFYTC